MPQKEITLREKILEASRSVLFTSGYDALSMRKIASATGVSATSYISISRIKIIWFIPLLRNR